MTPDTVRARALYEEICQRGFVLEPFQRLQQGLREVYPHAPWEGESVASVPG